MTVHGHGSIEIPRCPLPKNKRGNTIARYKRIELREGTRAAELAYGKDLVRKTLRQAAGLNNRPTVWKGQSQVKRLWLKKPDNPIFNDNWGNYAFKNVRFDSALLDDNRLVFSQKFKSEVGNFWELITKGDDAVADWLAMPRTR